MSSLKPLEQEIADILELRQGEGFAELPAWTRVRILAPAIAEAACVALQSLDPTRAGEVWPSYAEAAEKLFDEYIVPIDFPKVGPIAEIALESFLRRLIRPAIEDFAERLAA